MLIINTFQVSFFSCTLFLPRHFFSLSRPFYIPILSSVIVAASPTLVTHIIKKHMSALSRKELLKIQNSSEHSTDTAEPQQILSAAENELLITTL